MAPAESTSTPAGAKTTGEDVGVEDTNSNKNSNSKKRGGSTETTKTRSAKKARSSRHVTLDNIKQKVTQWIAAFNEKRKKKSQQIEDSDKFQDGTPMPAGIVRCAKQVFESVTAGTPSENFYTRFETSVFFRGTSPLMTVKTYCNSATALHIMRMLTEQAWQGCKFGQYVREIEIEAQF